jgi:hypothetical protein
LEGLAQLSQALGREKQWQHINSLGDPAEIHLGMLLQEALEVLGNASGDVFRKL